MSNLNQIFTETMQPLTDTARKLSTLFGRWIVAEMHERGIQTIGFGRVDPKWLLYRHDYGKEDLRRWLTEEKLAYLLARVFFYGRPRTLQDGQLCQQVAYFATVYGLIANPQPIALESNNGATTDRQFGKTYTE